MDINGVEQVNLVELGGADITTVHDLTGTGVTGVQLDLAGAPGSGVGDGQIDTVIVNATGADDAVRITAVATSAAVDGLATPLKIIGAETTDKLGVNALAGDNVLDGSAVVARAISLTLDGGDGDDVIIGGAGDDTLLVAPATTC